MSPRGHSADVSKHVSHDVEVLLDGWDGDASGDLSDSFHSGTLLAGPCGAVGLC